MVNKLVWYNELIKDIGFKAMWKQLSYDTQCLVIENLNKDGRISDEQYEAFYLSESFDFVPIYLPDDSKWISEQLLRAKYNRPLPDAPGIDGKTFKLAFPEAWGQDKVDILTGDNIAKPFSISKSQEFFDQQERQKQLEEIMKEAAEKILYYTPTIEEFHIGFEYEFHSMTVGGMGFYDANNNSFTKLAEPSIKLWNKEVMLSALPSGEFYTTEITNDAGDIFTVEASDTSFMYHRSLSEIEDLINKGQIRVKKIDQEDIESLGFIFKGRTVLDWYELPGKIEDNWNSYGYWNKVQLLHDKVKGKVKIVAFEFSEDKDENVLFQGDCKNKSELIKVLKQIGYENNTEDTK